ncbi:MAG: glycosyltransferase [Ferruginibacter sp.]
MVVPLDWGLGHATRCIPIIQELLSNGCEVILAAENNIHSLLQHEFQQLTIIPVPGYRISYSRKQFWLPLRIFTQIPKILYRVYLEHQWLKKVEKKFKIDAVIADNRFGLFNKRIPCIYITHQLLIKTGRDFTEKLAQRLHYRFIKKYDACWVPDFEGDKNLAGELSHPAMLPGNVNYIGCLSRLDLKNQPKKDLELLIIISGPEPQRSIFENIVLKQLQNYTGTAMLVRGLPGKGEKVAGSFSPDDFKDNIIIKNHLSAMELNEAIFKAEWVISRSGYTTIMDLVKLKQKAILVPTPGQTEQEYLARHLMKKQFFFSVKQEDFVLENVLKEVGSFPFSIPNFDMDLYKKKVRQFVESL